MKVPRLGRCRAASHPTRPFDEQPALEAARGHGEAADAPVERGELREELATALAALPAEQRAALVLVDMHGYPVAEAAAILGIPIGTVKSRCARGRARLLPRIAHLRGAVSRETPVSGSGGPPPPRNPGGGDSVPLLAARPVKDSRAGGGEAAP